MPFYYFHIKNVAYHATPSFPQPLKHLWLYYYYCMALGDTSVQFGFAIIAHLLCYCDKDRGVLCVYVYFAFCNTHLHDQTVNTVRPTKKNSN